MLSGSARLCAIVTAGLPELEASDIVQGAAVHNMLSQIREKLESTSRFECPVPWSNTHRKVLYMYAWRKESLVL
jgi:hypothetical protein